MKSNTTILLLLVAVLLGCFIWFVEREGETTEERAEQARKALRIDPESISFLRMQSGDIDVSCEKEDKVWHIVKPVRARAAAGEMDRILWGLKSLERSDVVTTKQRKENQLDESTYGLDMPRARITIGDDEARRTFLVGRDTPIGGGLFIKEAEGKDIIVTSSSILSLVPEEISAWRDRTLLDGARGDVTKLVLTRPGGFLQAARADDGAWVIQQPVSARADGKSVQQFLENLYALRVEEFVADDVADPTSYGLDKSSTALTVWQGDRAPEQTLTLGHTLETNTNLVYAKLYAFQSVFAVTSSIIDTLRITPEALRDRRLVPLSPWALTGISVERADQVLGLAKDAEGLWNLQQPVQRRADPSRVEEFLAEWTSTRIETFLDEVETDLSAQEGGADLVRLRFSRKVESEGGETAGADRPPSKEETWTVFVRAKDKGGRLLAQVEGETGMYEIDAAMLSYLSVTPLDYRDREVLAVLPEDVRSIAVRRNEERQTIERSKDGAFVTADGTAVDEDAANDLLDVVQHLRAVRYVAEAPLNLARYGLEEPAAVLTFGLRGDKGIEKSLLFGGDDEEGGEGGVYAMIRGGDVVFVVEKAMRAMLERDLYAAPPAVSKE